MVLIFLGCMSFSIGERCVESPPGTTPLVQEGEVRVQLGTEQDVYYPIPYASPPNLTIDDLMNECMIVSQEADHFRIRNDGKANMRWGSVPIKWKARGLKGPAKPATVFATASPRPEHVRSETEDGAALPAGPVPADSNP
jgi:hypothetical protein